jgi:hypothetical protein
MGTGSFLGVKRPGRDADHTPLSSAEGKKELSCTSTHPVGPPGPVNGVPLFSWHSLDVQFDWTDLSLQILPWSILRDQTELISYEAVSTNTVRVLLYSSLKYPACKSHLFWAALYCHLWPIWLYHIFPHLINGTIFGKKYFEHKTCSFLKGSFFRKHFTL